jgi:hypothetical protein
MDGEPHELSMIGFSNRGEIDAVWSDKLGYP